MTAQPRIEKPAIGVGKTKLPKAARITTTSRSALPMNSSIVSSQAECLSLGPEIAGKQHTYNCRNPDLPGDVTCKKDTAYNKDIRVAVDNVIQKITP